VTIGWDRLTRVAAPAVPALSRDDAKRNLRVDSGFDDAVIDALIAGAIGYCDGPRGRGLALVTQTWRLTLDRFERCIEIPLGPNVAVTAIEYVDGNGDTQTLSDPNTDWLLAADQDPAVLTAPFETPWPIARAQPGAVRIEFTCGFGPAAADVPADLVGALQLIVAAGYRDRENGGVPQAAKDVVDRYAPLTVA
jgi:uncharacterized phiE125 gp8 family phage protein